MEENELTGMLQSILGDPDTMNKLSSVAKELFGGEGRPDSDGESAEKPMETEKKLPSALQDFPFLSKLGDDKQVALIRALMPYLSAKRRSAAENMLRIMKLLKMSSVLSGSDR